MNLLLVNYEYPPIGGGAANATYFLVREFVRLGHRPVVLSSAFAGLPRETTDEEVRVIRLPAWRRRADRGGFIHMAAFAVSALRRIDTIVQRHRVDGAIVFFTLPCGPVGLHLHRRFGLPYIVSLRGGDVPGLVPELRWMHRLLTPWRRRVLAAAHAIVANSEGLAQLSRRTDPFPVHVIPNGVDLTFFSPRASPAAHSGVFRLMFVGRLHAQKNLPWLLGQLALLAQNPGPAFELHLVGDGPQRAKLESLTFDLGLTGRVCWHGWIERSALRALYQSADAIVNPSIYEGLPNVVLEAMACGLPVLASRVPGNDALVVEGETGHLFPLDDGGEFRARLRALMTDPAGGARLGAAGRRRVEQDFSWQHVAGRYLALFPGGGAVGQG